MDIETRLLNLENLVFSLIEDINSKNNYSNADIKGCRTTNENQQTSIDTNTTDISDNRDGIMESYENSMLNTEDISSLRSGLEEVYEMLLESEVTE